ncbi:hypothetical protein EC957_002039 [Mortierella hygrophila]|uniref:Uncharacterized protein n=1 Tax=Mortierella hygrophila TaxID=979708 RepID=A0A9P6FG31_9FUNG|nr:hypothetical protein EC957_002039 [Mortierella hygrophila]
METNTTPEHKQVFLNELHETLKRLDPRRVHSAGYYRILGRVVEYDMEGQTVKIESCFHDEFMSQPIIVPPGPRTTATQRNKGDLHHWLSTPEPQQKTGAKPHGNGKSNNKSTTIDLVTDSEDEEETVEPATSASDQQLQAGVSGKKRVELIVLSDDEEDPAPLLANGKRDECNGQEGFETTLEPTKPRRAPKVILWVDTQLLSAQAFEKHALYQFMGEVVYSPSINTTSTSSSVEGDRNSGRRKGRGGHWVLEARSARLMEGLDLWSYRQAILLTRDLIVQYEQQAREQEREREERDRAEWEKEVEMMIME